MTPWLRSARAGWCAALALLATLGVLLRAQALHRGLIYPDGYQYLLMAKGMAAHLVPTLRLGPGGALFVPNVDAALKPLFPALTAALSPVLGVREAANALTVVAAGAVVVLSGMLAADLTGSRRAGAVTAAAVLFSPALQYWSGFTGPDPLAQALALATGLALSRRRHGLAGTLGALCAVSRPEWLLVLGGAACAGLIVPATRAAASRVLVFGAFVLAGVIGVLRPPLAVPPGGAGLLVAALAAATLLQVGAAWAAARPRRAARVACGALGAIAVLCLSRVAAAPSSPLLGGWPMLLLGAVGIVVACRAGQGRPALMLLASLIVLGACYAYRNPGSDRYATQLLPLVCVAAGLGVAAWPARPRATVALAASAIAATVLLAPSRPPLAPDTFASLASRLAGAPAGTLYSAAPDAYGFLLPGRPQQALHPGASGLILLDGAQRAYDPGLQARGQVIARLSVAQGFERPDGTIDTGGALLVRGVVTAR